jgi:Recombination endonuclease VII
MTCTECGGKHYGKGLCRNHYVQEWRNNKGPAWWLEQDVKAKARRYGLDPAAIWESFLAHNGVCDICGEPPTEKHRLDMDHDHQTGAFRGWLCNACNTSLGRFKDDPALLRAAADYLDRSM